ncbi:hypothetical protein BU17DRAFT_87542 [Hysterangium stoloniferum]|nr:hypothetical protein BU17DRAFT_87542 [Hysterangium stoloniferum]
MSACVQDRDVPASPSSPLSPESSLTPHSHRSPHDDTRVCAPTPDSQDSVSEGAMTRASHSHTIPIPGLPPTALSTPTALYTLSHFNPIAHILAPTLDPREMRSYSTDYEESSGTPMSAFSPHSLQVSTTVASLYDTTARPFESRPYSEDYEQCSVSPVSSHPSQRHHTGSYNFPTVSHEPAPAVGPLAMHSHPQDGAPPTPSPFSSYPPRPGLV